jgi:hypothetical protein
VCVCVCVCVGVWVCESVPETAVELGKRKLREGT